tara:strand:+ start:87 stop:287 length:201 start_codon:yes stop_codon:yes gene_type:complete
MAEIFNKIGSRYYKPSDNAMKKIMVIEDQYKEEKKNFNKLISKADISTVEIKSFEVFFKMIKNSKF